MTGRSHAGRPVSQTSPTDDSLDPYAELPRVLPLGGHTPADREFNWCGWRPAEVVRPTDLPPYLIFGRLDPASFALSARGWSARWQGREADSFLEVAFEPAPGGWTIRQQWCGLDGGCASFAADRPFPMSLLQGLLARFPDLWEDHLKECLERRYAIPLIGHECGAAPICGVPDGAFYTLVIPVAANRLRFVRHWLRGLLNAEAPDYPVTAEARLVSQVINHVEGRAPEWTQDARVSFLRSVRDAGLPPDHLPVREAGGDGTAAWTSRRHLYCVFITAPFAGLLDLVGLLTAEPPVSWDALAGDTPLELRPVAIPAGLDCATTRISLWDGKLTTRLILSLDAPQSDPGPRLLADPGHAADDGLVDLARVDAISGRLLRRIGADRVIGHLM
jgi:hypothetical protein